MIQVFGTVCEDRFNIVEHFPKKGGWTNILERYIHVGGEASNTFVCISKWVKEEEDEADQQQQQQKIKVKLIGSPVKDDNAGQFILDYFKKLQFNTDSIQLSIPIIEKSDNEIVKITPTCDVYICPEVERTMLGIGFYQTEEYLFKNIEQKVFSHISFGDATTSWNWCTLDYNTPMVSNPLIHKTITSHGNIYIMDHIYDFSVESDEDLSKTNIIFQTSTDLLGTKGDLDHDSLSLVEDWVKKNPQCFIILTDGANGFLTGGSLQDFNHLDKGKVVYPIKRHKTFTIDNVVDPTGAGDAFRAGCLYGCAKKWDLEKILSFASASGGLNCRSIGGNQNSPKLSEILNILKLNNL
eukprot:gene2058-2538_t